MDVNSIMNTYNMSTLWNNLNPNSSTAPSVPMINNVDSSVKEQYTAMNYFGNSNNTELQDIYQQVEPTYGIPLTYNQSGNLTMPTNTTLPTDRLTPNEENIVSLLQNSNPVGNTLEENILSQYTEIEDGTFKSSLSGILSSDILSANPYNIYSAINSLANTSLQNTGNSLDVSA